MGGFGRFLRRWFGGEIAGMTVLLLLAGLAYGLVGPNRPGPWAFGGQVRAAEAGMRHLEIAIEHHRDALGRLPERLEELTAPPPGEPYPFLRTVPFDPWGSAYRYERLGADTYCLRSLGEDGEPDTDDDILWPRNREEAGAPADSRPTRR